jgi:hypothetical protein
LLRRSSEARRAESEGERSSGSLRSKDIVALSRPARTGQYLLARFSFPLTERSLFANGFNPPPILMTVSPRKNLPTVKPVLPRPCKFTFNPCDHLSCGARRGEAPRP